MRSDQEMMDLIMKTALEDGRIRAVELNGSRANPKVEKDCFQDFDIVYYVTSVTPFVTDQSWIDVFGERMIMQMPEAMTEPPGSGDGHFVYLMQFEDGQRIDLSLYAIDTIKKNSRDSLSIILLDKDGRFDADSRSDERDYLPIRPSQKAFSDCCNEYWWVSAYVAKALWRQQLYLAKHIYETLVRAQMEKMLQWTFGELTAYKVAPGKGGSRYGDHMPLELLARYDSTFPKLHEEEIWQSHFGMCTLFGELARSLAAANKLTYDSLEEKNVCAHIHHIKELPRDAKSIYK